jgi:hypothetical protein
MIVAHRDVHAIPVDAANSFVIVLAGRNTLATIRITAIIMKAMNGAYVLKNPGVMRGFFLVGFCILIDPGHPGAHWMGVGHIAITTSRGGPQRSSGGSKKMVFVGDCAAPYLFSIDSLEREDIFYHQVEIVWWRYPCS